MRTTTTLAVVLALGLALTPAAQAWISFLDFNDSTYPPDPPWIEFFNEGDPGAIFVDLGDGNFALRLDSPAHSDPEGPPDPFPAVHYNEYYVTDIPGYEKLGATRLRLDSFTPTGKENLLAISTPVAAPTLTLVDGHYWIWSNLSDQPNQPILDLGPAVPGEWHEIYILATVEEVDDEGTPIAGGARVWWDGDVVFDGPVDGGGSVFLGGYVEFGSGAYWQTTAGTVVDFDWVGWGDVNDFPVPPGITGDYNDDGKVDAADYVVWRANEGTMNPLPHDPAGGTIGQEQYDNWRANFGEMAGAGQGAAAVPEPATWGLVLLALLAAFPARRSR